MFTDSIMRRIAKALIVVSEEAALSEGQTLIMIRVIITAFTNIKGFNKGLLMVEFSKRWTDLLKRRQLAEAKAVIQKERARLERLEKEVGPIE